MESDGLSVKRRKTGFRRTTRELIGGLEKKPFPKGQN